ncbi:MAG: serine hydrolase domain-containing protein [Chrysiogenales bacterium]
MKNLQTIYIIAVVLNAIVNSTACQKAEVTHQFPLAEKHNIDETQLITAFAAFRQVPGALSIIVARDGEIVAETFTNYNNYGPDNTKNVHSVTKSFTGVLVGLAIDKGYIESINDPISKYLAGLVTFPDAVKANITIEKLLKMSFGHSWNGTTADSLYDEWMAAPDHLQYIIELPLVAPPGTVFNYSDGASHLLSVIITRATGQNTMDFAKANLFDPLQITTFL